MVEFLPETGGCVESVRGFAEEEAKIYRGRINGSEDKLKVVGKKYYVSQNGDDSLDGTSPQNAFRTLRRVAELGDSLKEGDGVFFERNSFFRTSEDLNLKSGVAYAAYGDGAKPVICGSEKNYAEKSLWHCTEAENIWRMSFPHSDAGIIVLDGGSETGKKRIKLSQLTENDDFYHDWDDGAIYFYSDRGNPGEIFNEIEIGIKTRLFHLPADVHDIVIDNIAFCYTGLFGIRADGGAENITVTNCTFSWIGGSLFNNKSNRFGNGIEFVMGCDNIVVKNCSFDQIFDSGVTFQIGAVPYRNFTVEACLFEYNGMSGFEWWTQGDTGERDGIPIDVTAVENIFIKNNLMRLTGFGWSKATRCPGHIRNGWRPQWHPNLKNFIIENNIFDYANGQIFASGWHTVPEGYKVRNNTYYQGKPAAVEADGRYQPFAPMDGKSFYVSDCEEFSAAVCAADEAPKEIKWL